jgi:hypothetical protein
MFASVMHLRPTAALVTVDYRGGGLDKQLQLASVLTHGEHFPRSSVIGHRALATNPQIARPGRVSPVPAATI